MSALPKTNYFKSIVTSECKMDIESKGVQSYRSQLYVRFLCFGNGALTALHDKSDGFFHCQSVLNTKDRAQAARTIRFLWTSCCGVLRALRRSIRCHIKNESWTSKLPYTPYTGRSILQSQNQRL